MLQWEKGKSKHEHWTETDSNKAILTVAGKKPSSFDIVVFQEWTPTLLLHWHIHTRTHTQVDCNRNRHKFWPTRTLVAANSFRSNREKDKFGNCTDDEHKAVSCCGGFSHLPRQETGPDCESVFTRTTFYAAFCSQSVQQNVSISRRRRWSSKKKNLWAKSIRPDKQPHT